VPDLPALNHRTACGRDGFTPAIMEICQHFESGLSGADFP
jgi:hypothetical protein